MKTLKKMFKEAENTPEYETERLKIDITELLSEIIETKQLQLKHSDDVTKWTKQIMKSSTTLKVLTRIFYRLGYRLNVSVTKLEQK